MIKLASTDCFPASPPVRLSYIALQWQPFNNKKLTAITISNQQS